MCLVQNASERSDWNLKPPRHDCGVCAPRGCARKPTWRHSAGGSPNSTQVSGIGSLRPTRWPAGSTVWRRTRYRSMLPASQQGLDPSRLARFPGLLQLSGCSHKELANRTFALLQRDPAHPFASISRRSGGFGRLVWGCTTGPSALKLRTACSGFGSGLTRNTIASSANIPTLQLQQVA